MSDTSTRVVPRSAGAIVDTALLRAARADVPPPVPDLGPTLAGRLRSLLQRLARTDADAV